MFTGLVATVGHVVARSAVGVQPVRLEIAAGGELAAAPLGASVAIDGCCLTVVGHGPGTLAFEATDETLARTTLGGLVAGDGVNLEGALRVGDPLGGHIVAGHVDAVGALLRRRPRESAVFLSIAAPEEVLALCAPRGSVAVAGVSLTVTSVDATAFEVACIPHTLAHTTLGRLAVGAPLNLEGDLLARYVRRTLALGGRAPSG